MPRKPNADVKHRLGEVMGRVEAELRQIEERRTELKHLISTLQYVSDGHEHGEAPAKRRKMPAAVRRKIAKAQKARWGKRGHRGHRAANAASPQWTEKDDAVIVQAAKSRGPVEAPALATALHPKLANRSQGAIRQRIAKLAHRGLLRQHATHDQGVPRMVVEAA